VLITWRLATYFVACGPPVSGSPAQPRWEPATPASASKKQQAIGKRRARGAPKILLRVVSASGLICLLKPRVCCDMPGLPRVILRSPRGIVKRDPGRGFPRIEASRLSEDLAPRLSRGATGQAGVGMRLRRG